MLQSSALQRTLMNAWHQARNASARIPSIEAFTSSDLAADYPGYFIIGHARSRKRQSYRYLEVGPLMTRKLGRDVSGCQFDEVLYPHALETVHEIYDRAIAQCRPHFWENTSMIVNSPPVTYRRVILPIHDDRGDGRCLFAVSEWP